MVAQAAEVVLGPVVVVAKLAVVDYSVMGQT